MSYEALTTRVGSAIEDAQLHNVDRRHRSGYLAARAGCVPIGEPSHFTDMVAYPTDLPDVVVKICSRDNDGYILFALARYHGILTGDHYPQVHSVAKVGHSWVFVIERLEEVGYVDFYSDSCEELKDRVREEIRTTLGQFNKNSERELHIDLHKGNFMRRGHTLVVSDPVGYAAFKIGADLHPVCMAAKNAEHTAQEKHEAERRRLQKVGGQHFVAEHIVRLNRVLGINPVRVARKTTAPHHPVLKHKPHLQNPAFMRGVAHVRA